MLFVVCQEIFTDVHPVLSQFLGVYCLVYKRTMTVNDNEFVEQCNVFKYRVLCVSNNKGIKVNTIMSRW